MEVILRTSCCFLASYILVCYLAFGFTTSLSETFYLLRRNFQMGWLFQVGLGVPVALLLPVWLETSERSDFQFLSFLAPASLLFVVAAPHFKEEFEGKVHGVAAIFGALCSLSWVALVPQDYGAMFIAAIVVGLFTMLDSDRNKNYIYWLEMFAFTSTFVSLFRIIGF